MSGLPSGSRRGANGTGRTRKSTLTADYDLDTIDPASAPAPVVSGGIFKNAAFEILKSEERLMTSGEITKLAMERKLLRCYGKTPENTMASALYTEVRKKASTTVFIKPKEGLFGLKAWLSEPWLLTWLAQEGIQVSDLLEPPPVEPHTKKMRYSYSGASRPGPAAASYYAATAAATPGGARDGGGHRGSANGGAVLAAGRVSQNGYGVAQPVSGSSGGAAAAGGAAGRGQAALGTGAAGAAAKGTGGVRGGAGTANAGAVPVGTTSAGASDNSSLHLLLDAADEIEADPNDDRLQVGAPEQHHHHHHNHHQLQQRGPPARRVSGGVSRQPSFHMLPPPQAPQPPPQALGQAQQQQQAQQPQPPQHQQPLQSGPSRADEEKAQDPGGSADRALGSGAAKPPAGPAKPQRRQPVRREPSRRSVRTRMPSRRRREPWEEDEEEAEEGGEGEGQEEGGQRDEQPTEGRREAGEEAGQQQQHQHQQRQQQLDVEYGEEEDEEDLEEDVQAGGRRFGPGVGAGAMTGGRGAGGSGGAMLSGAHPEALAYLRQQHQHQHHQRELRQQHLQHLRHLQQQQHHHHQRPHHLQHYPMNLHDLHHLAQRQLQQHQQHPHPHLRQGRPQGHLPQQHQHLRAVNPRAAGLASWDLGPDEDDNYDGGLHTGVDPDMDEDGVAEEVGVRRRMGWMPQQRRGLTAAVAAAAAAAAGEEDDLDGLYGYPGAPGGGFAMPYRGARGGLTGGAAAAVALGRRLPFAADFVRPVRVRRMGPGVAPLLAQMAMPSAYPMEGRALSAGVLPRRRPRPDEYEYEYTASDPEPEEPEDGANVGVADGVGEGGSGDDDEQPGPAARRAPVRHRWQQQQGPPLAPPQLLAPQRPLGRAQQHQERLDSPCPGAAAAAAPNAAAAGDPEELQPPSAQVPARGVGVGGGRGQGAALSYQTTQVQAQARPSEPAGTAADPAAGQPAPLSDRPPRSTVARPSASGAAGTGLGGAVGSGGGTAVRTAGDSGACALGPSSSSGGAGVGGSAGGSGPASAAVPALQLPTTDQVVAQLRAVLASNGALGHVPGAGGAGVRLHPGPTGSNASGHGEDRASGGDGADEAERIAGHHHAVGKDAGLGLSGARFNPLTTAVSRMAAALGITPGVAAHVLAAQAQINGRAAAGAGAGAGSAGEGRDADRARAVSEDGAARGPGLQGARPAEAAGDGVVAAQGDADMAELVNDGSSQGGEGAAGGRGIGPQAAPAATAAAALDAAVGPQHAAAMDVDGAQGAVLPALPGADADAVQCGVGLAVALQDGMHSPDSEAAPASERTSPDADGDGHRGGLSGVGVVHARQSSTAIRPCRVAPDVCRTAGAAPAAGAGPGAAAAEEGANAGAPAATTAIAEDIDRGRGWSLGLVPSGSAKQQPQEQEQGAAVAALQGLPAALAAVQQQYLDLLPGVESARPGDVPDPDAINRIRQQVLDMASRMGPLHPETGRAYVLLARVLEHKGTSWSLLMAERALLRAWTIVGVTMPRRPPSESGAGAPAGAGAGAAGAGAEAGGGAGDRPGQMPESFGTFRYLLEQIRLKQSYLYYQQQQQSLALLHVVVAACATGAAGPARGEAGAGRDGASTAGAAAGRAGSKAGGDTGAALGGVGAAAFASVCSDGGALLASLRSGEDVEGGLDGAGAGGNGPEAAIAMAGAICNGDATALVEVVGQQQQQQVAAEA